MAFNIWFIHAPQPLLTEHPSLGWRYAPIWALTLASHLTNEPDLNFDLYDTCITSVEAIPPAELFLFSGYNQDYEHICKILRSLKSRYPAAKFVIGGPICWSFDKAGDLARLVCFDHIVIGDGEGIIAHIVQAIRWDIDLPSVIRVQERFDLSSARLAYHRLLEKYQGYYRGAVIEVSRGCPFLCEFCDIRIMEDNNRSRNKPPDLVIQELDAYSQRGVTVFMFACDNFIGDPAWAGELVVKMVAWQERTGFCPNIFTWLTINLCRYPKLMQQMRKAGFNTLFIGVESFCRESLLETAKIQNRTKMEVSASLRIIQSYGFLVVAGLIFGFDSDTHDLYQIAENGLRESCLLCFSPSLLVALPGTPLHRRIKLASRLRGQGSITEGGEPVEIQRDSDRHGSDRFQSNIKFLLPRDVIVNGFIDFLQRTADGKNQYERFREYCNNLDTGNYIPRRLNPPKTRRVDLRRLVDNRTTIQKIAATLLIFSANPRNLYFAFKGLSFILIRCSHIPDAWIIFKLWMAAWAHHMRMSRHLSEEAFDVESFSGPVYSHHILPREYMKSYSADIPKGKNEAQLRATNTQLRKLAGTYPHDGCPSLGIPS